MTYDRPTTKPPAVMWARGHELQHHLVPVKHLNNYDFTIGRADVAVRWSTRGSTATVPIDASALPMDAAIASTFETCELIRARARCVEGRKRRRGGGRRGTQR